MGTRCLIILLFAALVGAPALAGDTLSIRLVEASNGEKVDNSGKDDIIDVLKKTLSYQTYTVIASATAPLPAKKETQKLGRYTVVCSGPQDNLQISVNNSRKELLQTKVKLKDGTPLVLGGFPSANGKMVLVFVAQ